MRQAEFLQQLIQAISPEEWPHIRYRDPTLIISDFNREVLLSMENTRAGNREVDMAAAKALHHTLQSYLNTYMADQPEAHRWIILACLFLTYVKELPMHPQQIVNWKRLHTPEGIRYRCPCRDGSPGSVCLYCVCEAEEQ